MQSSPPGGGPFMEEAVLEKLAASAERRAAARAGGGGGAGGAAHETASPVPPPARRPPPSPLSPFPRVDVERLKQSSISTSRIGQLCGPDTRPPPEDSRPPPEDEAQSPPAWRASDARRPAGALNAPADASVGLCTAASSNLLPLGSQCDSCPAPEAGGAQHPTAPQSSWVDDDEAEAEPSELWFDEDATPSSLFDEEDPLAWDDDGEPARPVRPRPRRRVGTPRPGREQTLRREPAVIPGMVPAASFPSAELEDRGEPRSGSDGEAAGRAAEGGRQARG